MGAYLPLAIGVAGLVCWCIAGANGSTALDWLGDLLVVTASTTRAVQYVLAGNVLGAVISVAAAAAIVFAPDRWKNDRDRAVRALAARMRGASR